MVKLFRKHSKTIGLPPGTIIESAKSLQNAVITVIDYNDKNLQETKVQRIEDCFPFKDSPTLTWINIEGIASDVIQKIGDHYKIHPLVSEDIINLGQRPKMEDYNDYIFIVLKMIYFSQQAHEIIDEQVSLILGPNFVISIQEKPGDVFDPIRQRIRQCKGRIRKMAADYLAYSLLDAVIDNYFIILEKRGEDIEILDEKIMAHANETIGREIHRLKRDMIYLRKQIWPLREVINSLQRNESKLIHKQTLIYLRDVYDHTIQVMDTIESFRDMLSGLHDSYLSAISNKMNEIMKVLTIFAAIFIPLSFIAGVYGMNFEFMPELKIKYGYYVLLTVMFMIGGGMVMYFKKRKWM